MRHITILTLVTCLGVVASSAHASIILSVDATDMSAVVFSGTGEAASVSDSHQGYRIWLTNAVATGSTSQVISGSLRPTQGSLTYNICSSIGSNLSISGPNQQQTFTNGLSALTGQTTVNLSTLSFGTSDITGDIHIANDFGQDTGVVVGQYSVHVAPVPEPASLACLGLGALAVLRRRRGRLIA